MDDRPPFWVAEIVTRLDRIEKALHARQPTESANDILTPKEVAEKLRCETPAALYRRLAELGVRPCAHGKYRRGDLDNAIARAALRAQKQGRPQFGP